MKDYVEIICLTDRSGSMNPIWVDTIGSFNSFIETQKNIEGDAKITHILFNDNIQTIEESVDIKSITPFDGTGFNHPQGGTALYDAIGFTIDNLGKRLSKLEESERPSKVIFTILTDGEENSSKKYTQKQINQMIKHQTDVYSWEFIFLAANQDAFMAGSSLGISANNTANFSANATGIRSAYDTISSITISYRKPGN